MQYIFTNSAIISYREIQAKYGQTCRKYPSRRKFQIHHLIVHHLGFFTNFIKFQCHVPCRKHCQRWVSTRIRPAGASAALSLLDTCVEVASSKEAKGAKPRKAKAPKLSTYKKKYPSINSKTKIRKTCLFEIGFLESRCIIRASLGCILFEQLSESYLQKGHEKIHVT